jgi:FAD/FMN-containing dehydrogenase
MEKLKSEVLRELEKQTGVEVRVDQASRILYSTDASIYQIKPLGVVFPFTADDLVGVVEFADKYKIPLIPRGSGTGLVGQAVGSGLIVDCSRHLNKIIEVDQESQTAIVEPGVILDDLNQAVGRYGLKYGPDPASSDRATLGGMIGNNSAGAHSIRYGMTSDHILSLDVVLSDGSVANFQRIPINLAKNFIDKTGPEGRLYQVCMDIRENYRGAIQDSWPLTWRRSSGYGINYLLPWSSSKPPFWQGVGEITSYPPIESDHINLAPLLVGSEGTLAVFLRAKLNLAKTSPQKILGILAFNEVTAACDAVPDILDLEPSAVELIPRSLISRARSIPAYASMLWFIDGDPDALLVVEFEGNDHKFLYEKIKKLGSNVIIAETTEQQEQVWAVRKVGLGLLMSISGDAKPLPFIEDVAVPVEKLGEYVRGIQYLLDQYGIEGNLYAHASAGCLHFRPLINTKTERGIIELRELAYEVGKLAKSLGGAISGEHGDGLARSELLELMFGSEIVEQFTRIKKAADPERILNPGKKVDPLPMDQNLRYGVMYEQKSWQPILDFSCQDSLSGAIEMCNGAGVCLSKTGVMCPSFQTTREEKHSTRGRANLLRFLISGNTHAWES